MWGVLGFHCPFVCLRYKGHLWSVLNDPVTNDSVTDAKSHTLSGDMALTWGL